MFAGLIISNLDTAMPNTSPRLEREVQNGIVGRPPILLDNAPRRLANRALSSRRQIRAESPHRVAHFRSLGKAMSILTLGVTRHHATAKLRDSVRRLKLKVSFQPLVMSPLPPVSTTGHAAVATQARLDVGSERSLRAA